MAFPSALRSIAAGFLLVGAAACAAPNPPIPPPNHGCSAYQAVWKRDGCLRWRLFLGRAIRVSASQGRHLDRGRLRGRLRENCDLSAGGYRNYRARRIGSGGLRSLAHHLRAVVAHLFLGGARPDAVEPARSGRGNVVPLCDFLCQRRSEAAGRTRTLPSSINRRSFTAGS